MVQLTSLALVGRWPEAAARYQLEIQRARKDYELHQLAWACAAYAERVPLWVDAQVALDHARQGVEIAEKAGDPRTRTQGCLSLGQACLRVGSYREAVTVLERSQAIVQESHAGLEFESQIASALARAYVENGDSGRALRAAEKAARS
jgi:tetratricopeptide (TPR) repeat protein